MKGAFPLSLSLSVPHIFYLLKICENVLIIRLETVDCLRGVLRLEREIPLEVMN